jgi:uncharacterized protein YjdB
MSGILAKGTKLYMFGIGDIVDESKRIKNLYSIGDIGTEIDEVDDTTLDSEGYKDYVPGLMDIGAIDVELRVDDDTYKNILQEQFKKPSDEAMVYFGVSFPFGTADSNNDVMFKGYLQNLKVTEITADGMLKITFSIRGVGKVYDFVAPDKANLPTEVAFINSEPIDMTIGGSGVQLEYSVAPEGTTVLPISFKSSDEEVVVVSTEGLVEAVGVGTTTVSVSVNYNDAVLISDSITVNVSEY